MHSFDVFDTLITRTTATPRGIFALMQAKLQQSANYSGVSGYIKENFYLLRVHSEELARTGASIARAEEITLAQIYAAMNTTGSLSDEDISGLMELERSTEYEHSVGIYRNIAKVKELLRLGERVVLLSDMYLDREIIQGMLTKADPVFAHIKLYVSSEYMQAKWTGNLYKLVKMKEQIDYDQWFHYGDNSEVDVQAAARLHIRSKWIPFEPLKPYELKALEAGEEDVFYQMTIGSARNVRLQNKLSGPAAIGASIGGAVLFPYVWWVLQESLNKGIRRLYFVARDGYVLKKVADKVIEACGFEIETRYLYGSRRAWRMASFSEKNGNLYRFVGWSYARNIEDIAGLADVLQIPADEILPFMPAGYQNYKKPVTIVEVSELVKLLDKDGNFKTYLRSRHREKRNRVVSYLKQEMDLSDDAFAFVDLSGGGFTQGCLAEIMSDFYDKKIRMFYLKMDRLNLMDNCISYNFLPSFLYLGLIIEMLCRAPHGQAMGYEDGQGEIVPELNEDGEAQALIRHGFNEYMFGIERFTETANSLLKYSYRPDNLELLLSYMEYVTKTPDAEILDFFGGMPNGVTGREKEIVEFAPVLTWRQIRSLFLYRTSEPVEQYYRGSSLEYSLLRCSPAEKRKIEFYRKISPSLLGKLARLPKIIGKEHHRYSLASNFPCELLDERIILYGAGQLGQEIYKKIKRYGKSKVVQWVDKDFEKYRDKGLAVSDPLEIGQVEFDNIVIGVLNEKLAGSIWDILMGRGIPGEKIKWIDLWPKWE